MSFMFVVQVGQNHSACDKCYVTKPWWYLTCYLSLSSGEIISTSCHICGSWYLPISIKGWVINSDENGFLDVSCQILNFSAYNAEVFNRYIMSSGVMMVMDGWWGFHVFFVSSCKCSAWLPNIILFTDHSVTLLCITPLSARWYICPWL